MRPFTGHIVVSCRSVLLSDWMPSEACVCECMDVCLCLGMWRCVCVVVGSCMWLPVCFCVSVRQSACVCVSVCLSVWLSVSVSVSVYASRSVCLCVFVFGVVARLGTRGTQQMKVGPTPPPLNRLNPGQRRPRVEAV